MNLNSIEGFYEAATSVLEGLGLPRTLQKIADIAREMMQVHYAALGVPSEDGITLRAFVTSGIQPGTARQIEHEPIGKGLLGAIFEADTPIRLENLHTDHRSSGFCDNHPMMTSFLGVPVIGRNHQRLGNLYLCDRLDGQSFDEADEAIVVIFASFAAIAIENANLHKQLQKVALKNEQDRIGMELHDSVIQDIYAVGMKLEIIRGKTPLADTEQEQFNHIMGDLNRIIDDIRMYIQNLQNLGKTYGSSFQQQLENLTAHFKDFSQVDVSLHLPDEMPILSDQQYHALAQITREALANIARHAEASAASITIRLVRDNLQLIIKDDGKGMDSEWTSQPAHFGLMNMEQRARRLKGVMEINSQLGEGTTIEVIMPIK
jgi:signal transduction histidine kinase